MRSRVITFPDALNLRPTPDRVRETLFNWLGQTLYGKHCLDLFAGSGALGFEAASRGAKQVLMNDKNPTVYRSLINNQKLLHCEQIISSNQDALQLLQHNRQKFDLIFLDPPFDGNLLPELIERLPEHLNPEGMVYIESAQAIPLDPPWHQFKQGRAGKVHYQLLTFGEIR